MGAWDLRSLLLGAALGPIIVFALRQLRDSSKNRAKQDCSHRGLRVLVSWVQYNPTICCLLLVTKDLFPCRWSSLAARAV